jgi:MoxR-like ATPase
MKPELASLKQNIASVYRGSPASIDRLLCCLLARGHCLIEDVPGVGKTVLASALARSIDASFSRLQLTPDLTPSDILGVSIYRRDQERFEFKRGPIFASIVLADEINRATPRTQTALLEAMNDAAVTVDGVTHALDQPFMLVATQNPSDFEGTFPLPENQLDRFLMRISLGYPAPEEEVRILEDRPATGALQQLRPVLGAAQVRALQEQASAVRVELSLREYIVAIATATRRSDELLLGLSTRGALALTQAARATALLRGRDYVTPDDILDNFLFVAAHRVIPRTASGVAGADPATRALQTILRSVPSPA